MKSEAQKTTARGGVGFWGLLQIVLIVLKLTGVISWPWLAVLAPAIFAVILWIVGFVLIVVLTMATKD